MVLAQAHFTKAVVGRSFVPQLCTKDKQDLGGFLHHFILAFLQFFLNSPFRKKTSKLLFGYEQI